MALDLPGTEALRLLDRLAEARWVKIGPILFTREGPAVVRELVARNLQVFLDLKWHDIPHTVAAAVEAARELGATLATVHTLGGPAMLQAAQQAAGPDLGLVGVTVLTSHTADGYAALLGRGPVRMDEEVGRLARLAVEAGLRGIVCSPLEVAAARRAMDRHSWIVVPGIRRGAEAVGDQARFATAGAAVRAGATHLVVGRPILEAPDPGAAFRALVGEAAGEGSVLL